jgi:3-mercaptopyruvate sulfurtransferase SseA
MERGWQDVTPLAGGFDAWQDAGLPVEPKAGAGQSIG